MKFYLLEELNVSTKLLIQKMRITCFMLFVFATGVFANTATSQVAKVSINLKNGTVEKVIDSIEKQTDYLFVYNKNDIDLTREVTVDIENHSVAEVLSEIFDKTNIIYAMEGSSIMLMTRSAVQQQGKTISGKITDRSGTAVPGATIIVKGTTLGVTSNSDGSFSLSVPENSQTLSISFVGMKLQEIAIGKKSSFTVILEEETIGLDEIVAVGYGVQKKVNLTGAVENVAIKDLATRPLTNTSVALQGKVSGVYVMQNSGQPGRDYGNILIRGVGTLNNNNPLILIDGIAGSMNDVNPMDVESISVLKDAASAAIYGNRAANGVILITTRRGHGEKMHVEYTGYMGVQNATYLPEVLNSYEHATLYEEAAKNSGKPSKYSADMIAKYKAGGDPLYPNTNWQDVWFKPATMKSHFARLSGSTDVLSYSFSGGYLDQDGVLLGTGFKRYNFRSNIDAYFLKNKKLHVSTNMAGLHSDIEEAAYGSTGVIRAINRDVPTDVVTWPDGSYGPDRNYALYKSGGFNNGLRNGFTGNIHADYQVVKNITLETNYGVDWVHSLSKNFWPDITQYTSLANYTNKRPTNTNSELTEGNSETMSTTLNALIRYKGTLNEVHHFNVFGGYSEETMKIDYSSGYRKYLLSSQPQLDIGDVSTQTNSGGADATALRSYFGRVNYDFKGKYLLEANVRHDGSSRFAKNQRYGTFPSASAGWRLSEESFLKDNPIVNNLKLRGSWGQLGNQNINTYYAASDILATGANYIYGGTFTPGVAVTTLTNKSVSWETTTQTNFGLDANLFKKLSVTANYFWKKTDNILMNVPIPVTLGALNTPYQNLGSMKNTGWELTLGYNDKIGDDFTFDANLNLSHFKNTVTNLGGLGPIYGSSTILKEGESYYSFYGYQAIGIFQNQAEIDAAPKQSENPKPGDIRFKDLDGDGKITLDKDRKVLGKQVPDLLYSLQLNFGYKGFDFKTFFQGVAGISAYSSLELVSPFFNGASGGAWLMNRWTPEHPSTTQQRVFLDGVRGGIASSYYLENASYFRLKNVELGYTLPQTLLSKIGVAGLRVFTNVQNAFTITKYKGFDPEKSPGNTRSDAHTQVRIASLGLSVRF